MFISFLLCMHIFYSAAEVLDNGLFKHTSENISQQIWHSYKFDTGTGNREELQFSKVELIKNFSSAVDVYKWKVLYLNEEVAIVGLGANFITIINYNLKNELYSYKEDIEEFTSSFCIFQRWDAKEQKMQSYVVVAVFSQNSFKLKWYIIHNRQLKFLWDWALYKFVSHIDIIKLNLELKLLVVSHHNYSRKDPSAEIFSFNINSNLDIWLFQKINLFDIPSSIIFFSDNDNYFLSASFPTVNMVHIYRYSKSQYLQTSDVSYFVLYQKIFRAGLKSLTSFRIDYHWYLAIASENSTIFKIRENSFFYPISHTDFGNCNSWLVIPVVTFREDMILLSSSSKEISVMTWMGNENFQLVGSLGHLYCGDDDDCLQEISEVNLENSASFYFKGHQNLLLLKRNGSALLLRLLLKFKPKENSVILKLNDIKKKQVIFQEEYSDQIKLTAKLATTNGKKAKSDKETGNNEHVQVQTKSQENSLNISIKSLSRSINYTEVIEKVTALKDSVDDLVQEIEKLRRNLNSSQSSNHVPSENSFLPENVDGIIFHGDILIKDFTLTSLNGYDTGDWFNNSFRKDKQQRIGGSKTAKSINVNNITFKKITDILASEIVFTDDPWEKENGNIIFGDIEWKNSLHILKNFFLSFGNSSSSKPVSNRLIPTIENYFFDQLMFEKMEVTEDTYIQGSINSQPMILPIHFPPMDISYLDTVKQARVEYMYVKSILDVNFINGRNFSHITENLLNKTNKQLGENECTKIDGVFSTGFLQTDQINSIRLLGTVGLLSFDQQSINSNNDTTSILRSKSLANKNYSKRFSDIKSRRNIKVFENLELTGVLLLKKINNIDWLLLNDTVKKDDQIMHLKAPKKFCSSLTVQKCNILNTLNRRSMNKLLNNFSSQEIWSSQTFTEVSFVKSHIGGLWNNISVEYLLQSLIRISSNGTHNSSFIFPNEYVLFSNIVNVTETFNSVSIKEEDIYRNNSFLNDKAALKFIKVTEFFINGSVNTNYKINNVNLYDLNSQRVSLKYPQTIKEIFVDVNSSTIENLSLQSLNNNNITSLIDSGGNTVALENFLKGKINRVKKLLVKEYINTSNNVCGFNLSNIVEDGIRITKPSFLTGTSTFENIVYFDNINITNSIDGFSLKKLEKDIILKHSRVFLSGAKNFSVVKVTNDMKVRTLNGHLIQEVISFKGDQIVKGVVKINGDVVVEGNISSNGGINGVTLSDLLKKYSTRHNSYIFTGSLKLTNKPVIVDNLVIGDKAQKSPFDFLINDVVVKTSDFFIKGKKCFKGKVHYKESVNIEELVNGVNFTNFFNNVLFINQPEEVKGLLKVKEVVMKTLEIEGNFNSSMINNINTHDWLEESILLDGRMIINGKKDFIEVHALENVEVDFINGNLPSSVISLKNKQFIPALVSFPVINTISDLSVTGLINKKNLFEEFQNSVLLTGNQTLSNKLVINKEFVVKENLFVQTIRGRSTSDLITLYSEEIIKCKIKFDGLVTAQKIINLNSINKLNIVDWDQKSVLLNREQALVSPWFIEGHVKVKSIKGDGILNGENLTRIANEILETKSMVIKMNKEAEKDFRNQCHNIKELSKQFNKLPFLFHQFEVTSIIETPSVIESVINFKVKNVDYLILSFVNDCLSKLYKWDKERLTFFYLKQINIGPVSKWLVAYQNNATFLITSSLKGAVKCEKNFKQGNIWVFNNDSDKYGHLLTSNAFVDIIHENSTSGIFFTLEENGALYKWNLTNTTNIFPELIVNVGQGNYRFIDFSITNGLAVSNGKEIKQIKNTNNKVLHSNLPFPSGNIVALTVNKRTLAALVLKDKIVIFENIIEGKIFSVIHTYNAGSILWVNFGFEKQAFLIIASHHKLIDIYEYRSVLGLIKRMSLQIFSSKLQSVELPSSQKYRLHKFVLVIQKKKIIFLEAEMLGDYFEENVSLCD